MTHPVRIRSARSARWAALCVVVFGVHCAGVEKGRYGVDSVEIEGANEMAAGALRPCLLTQERDHFGFALGVGEPVCGTPPFDSASPRVQLWRWPWKDWPTFNKAVLDKDLERIVRWYRSRGFYEARVTDVRIDPPEAGLPGAASVSGQEKAKPRCDTQSEECTASITIVIDEGEPLHVSVVEITGISALPADLRERLRKALPLARGERFDERDYDEGKQRLITVLTHGSHAAAAVSGEVQITTAAHTARVVYHVDPGPAFVFGKVSVKGNGPLSAATIIAAAALEPNTPFNPDVEAEIQREVQVLGGFAAVTVEHTLHPETRIADLEVQVQRATQHALRLGVGLQSGSIQRGDDPTSDSVPQWDVHLLARYTYTNVFNTLGEFTIDERPRIIYNDAFPKARDPSFGNIVGASINQPGLIEARTDATLSTSWDLGPDPYGGFDRSDIIMRLAFKRRFWGRRVELTAAVEQDFYVVPQEDNVPLRDIDLPSSYSISFVAQRAILDLRDSQVRPTEGWYFALLATEAPRWAASDWTLFLFRPEVRAYVSLPLDIVFATRLALGWMIITNASEHLDATSQELGPSVYRLRGGGANSVRGFPAGTLGVGIDGGTRRWEAMFETRLPIGQSFEIAALLDFGDVSIDAFRFDYLNTSAGIGLRYHSPIGALRLDTSFRILPLARLDGTRPEVPDDELLFFDIPGAVHFTIGDAF